MKVLGKHTGLILIANFLPDSGRLAGTASACSEFPIAGDLELRHEEGWLNFICSNPKIL
jgi:hypothetical protein